MKKNKQKIITALKKYNLLILILLFVIVATILSPRFLTINNFMNLLQQSSITGIVAIGMTFVILTGGIDLSVGSILALAGMTSSIFVKTLGLPIVISMILTVVIGIIVGMLTGMVITKFKVPDFIATLAMMVSIRGVALLLTNGKPIFGLSSSFRYIGAGFIFNVIPVSGIIWIILTIIAFGVLKFTSRGRAFYAVGGNVQSAYLSGIRTERIKTNAYMISGALAAFSGIMLAAWLSTGQPSAGNGMELEAIASSVIGGASLSGGAGGVIGTFGGVLLLTIITNILNLVGVASYFQQIIKGLIILIAVIGNNVLSSNNK
jgi:ribose transport system permease protein